MGRWLPTYKLRRWIYHPSRWRLMLQFDWTSSFYEMVCWNFLSLGGTAREQRSVHPKRVYNRFANCKLCNQLTFPRLQTRDLIGWHLTEPLSRQVSFWYYSTFVRNLSHAAAPFGPLKVFRAGDGMWARSVSARTAGSTGSPIPRWIPSQVWQ